MLNIPITFETLLKVVDSLSPEQKRLLRSHLDLTSNPKDIDLTKSRRLGLHPGAMQSSDDFDEPVELT